MLVAKWGNSLAVRLPRAVVEVLHLKAGDEIEITIGSDRSFSVKRDHSRQKALAGLRKFRGRLPASFKFDREATNERR